MIVTRDCAIILFAHGARDPGWAVPLHRIAVRLRERHPDTRVELAFLECMQPTLQAAVACLEAEGVLRMTLVPLFLARGGHLKQDLPRLLDDIHGRHPGVRIEATPAIGDSAELIAVIADWAFAQHRSCCV